MERVERGVAATISIEVSVDEVPTNPAPDLATLEVVRDDGTVIIPAGTNTTDTGDGTFQFVLTPTHTAQLDKLTAYWSLVLAGHTMVVEREIEVVGGYFFELSEARADPDLEDPTEFPRAKLVDARAEAEGMLEHACGVAFVPRYHRERVSGQGTSDLLLSWPKVRRIRSVSVDGTVYAPTAVAALAISPAGAHTTGTWTDGVSNTVVGYEHGFDTPPPGVSHAAIRLTKHILLPSPMDDRALRVDADQGSFVMAQPGMRGSEFGIPAVDRVVKAYQFNAAVA